MRQELSCEICQIPSRLKLAKASLSDHGTILRAYATGIVPVRGGGGDRRRLPPSPSFGAASLPSPSFGAASLPSPSFGAASLPSLSFGARPAERLPGTWNLGFAF